MNFRASVLILTFAVAAITGLSAAKPPVRKPAPKKTAPAAKKAPVRKPLARTTSAKKRSASATRAAVPAPYRQATPTPDRYKEIQGALATKGYLKSEPNGVWDAQSVDALKRYQADRHEDASGKLTAASLIGLGLGPNTASLTAASGLPAPPVSVP